MRGKARRSSSTAISFGWVIYLVRNVLNLLSLCFFSDFLVINAILTQPSKEGKLNLPKNYLIVKVLHHGISATVKDGLGVLGLILTASLSFLSSSFSLHIPLTPSRIHTGGAC